MDFLGKIFGGVSKLLNAVAPIAMLIPGMQWVSVAAMVANVANGLMQKPPDWGGILTNLVTSAIPMGLGKALQAFKGGTAMEFAKLFSDKLSGTLGEVAKKVGNSQFSGLVSQLQAKVTSEAFTTRFASFVNKATHTAADAHLSADQIGRGLNDIAYQTRDFLGPVAEQITWPLTQATSTFLPGVQSPVVMQTPQAGEGVVSSAPVERVRSDLRA